MQTLFAHSVKFEIQIMDLFYEKIRQVMLACTQYNISTFVMVANYLVSTSQSGLLETHPEAQNSSEVDGQVSKSSQNLSAALYV